MICGVFESQGFHIKRVTNTVQGVAQLSQPHAVGVSLKMKVLDLNPFVSSDLHGMGGVCVCAV